jgi:DNA-3-methyladenine glycosylase I
MNRLDASRCAQVIRCLTEGNSIRSTVRDHVFNSGTNPYNLTMASKPVARRCSWAESDPLMTAYHDEEWGVPEYDSRALWEKLMLDGFQAGLSWSIILRKREAFRKAFKNFDPVKVARFDESDIARLLEDDGIVRSRAKIEATIGGARAYLAMRKEGEEFSAFCWGMAGGKPIPTSGVIPAKTPLSEEMSKALRKRGFKFVGPVIVYAWMQAVGIVNDHAADCFRRRAVRSRRSESGECGC